MVATEVIRMVFGIIGNVVSFGLFVLEVPTFYRIIKNNSPKWVIPEYHLVMILYSVFWVFYGMPFISPRSILVLTGYGIDLSMHLAFLIIILLFATDNKKRMYIGGVFLIELVVISLVIVPVITLAPTAELKKKFVESACSMSTLLAIGGNALFLAKILDTDSVECVQFRTLVGRTLYALCWTIYASFKFDSDYLLLAVNIYGTLWGLLMLKIYDVYYKISANSGADEKLATADVQVQGMGTGADKKLPIAERHV